MRSATLAAAPPTTSGWIGRLTRRSARASVRGAAVDTGGEGRLAVERDVIVDAEFGKPPAHPVARSDGDGELMVHRPGFLRRQPDMVGRRQPGKGRAIGGGDLPALVIAFVECGRRAERMAACSASSRELYPTSWLTPRAPPQPASPSTMSARVLASPRRSSTGVRRLPPLPSGGACRLAGPGWGRRR